MNKLTLLLLITGFWLGLVFGLSFIEAPLKFQAPGITTELGLGIGKLVFGTLNKIEIVFSIILLILSISLFKKMDRILIGLITIVLFIVFVQSVFLLPSLNERVNIILSGQEVAASKDHITFIIMEVAKVISLFFVFVKSHRLL